MYKKYIYILFTLLTIRGEDKQKYTNLCKNIFIISNNYI